MFAVPKAATYVAHGFEKVKRFFGCGEVFAKTQKRLYDLWGQFGRLACLCFFGGRTRRGEKGAGIHREANATQRPLALGELLASGYGKGYLVWGRVRSLG